MGRFSPWILPPPQPGQDYERMPLINSQNTLQYYNSQNAQQQSLLQLSLNSDWVTICLLSASHIDHQFCAGRDQFALFTTVSSDCHTQKWLRTQSRNQATLGKSFNLSGPESSIHKMQIIIILITTGSFGSLDELIPVSANSTWHNSRCSVSVSRKHSVDKMLHEWTHWPFPKWRSARSEERRRCWQGMSLKNSHQAAQEPLLSTTRKSRTGGIASSVASSIWPSCPAP